jgi:ribose transport system substrate-binding protein
MINNRTSSIRSKGGYGRGYGHSSGFKRRGFRAFLKRNVKIVGLAAALLAVAVVCIFLFTGGSEKTVAQNSAGVSPGSTDTTGLPTPVPTVNIEGETEDYSGGEYNYEGVDTQMLAGLAGTDNSLFTEGVVGNGIKVGITVGKIETNSDKLLLGEMQETTADAVKKGLVYQVYCYDAGGSYNQQLQDMKCLIKNEVDVIVVCATGAEGYKMVTSMAAKEGIPVVAYDAPLNTGYAVNIVTDQASWGEKQGQFIAQNLEAGNIALILGSENDSVDTARRAAIESKLSGNTALTITASYAMWDNDKAKEAVTAMIGQNTKIDGIITEDGMAQGILDAFVEAGKLPKVMCGDVSAGFIKDWYALRHGGILIPQEAKKKNHTPPPPKIFPAEGTEFIFCAQPSPARASSIAFEVAMKLAQGRTLKQQGAVFNYSTVVSINEENLSYYYEMVKDLPDSFMLSDPIDAQAAESLFNPAEE